MHVYYCMLVLIVTHGSETKAYDPVYIIIGYSHAEFCLNFIEQCYPKGIALIGSHVAIIL